MIRLRYLLAYASCTFALSACARGAEIAVDGELPPEQRQAMAAGVARMVEGATWKGQQTFRLHVTDPEGHPLVGVPLQADIITANGNAIGQMLTGDGFLSRQKISLQSAGGGIASWSGSDYIGAWLRVDFERIGSTYICPHRSESTIWPHSDAAQDRTWVEKGEVHRLRRDATVQLLPTKGPEQLLKMSWRPGIREADAWRPVMLTLAEYGVSADGGEIDRYNTYDARAPVPDFVLRGGRTDGKRRAVPMAKPEDPRFSPEPCPWWFEIISPRGVGIIDASEEPWPYHAPEQGWKRSWRFASEDGSITSRRVRLWFRRPGTPVRYALFDGIVRLERPAEAPPGSGWVPQDDIGLKGTLWINPTGSRNLERPGCDTQARYWKPAPERSVNLNRHTPMIAAWAAEPPEGRVELIEDQPSKDGIRMGSP